MYAIIETGGKQYKVEAGDIVRIEKVGAKDKSKVRFSKVLAFSDGKKVTFGTPYLESATVNGTVTHSGKGDKVVIFKFKNKKDYRKKQGHRQPYTEVEIDNFTINGNTEGKKPAKKVEKSATATPKTETAEKKADTKKDAGAKKETPEKKTTTAAKKGTAEKKDTAKTTEKKTATKKTTVKKETTEKKPAAKKATAAAPKKDGVKSTAKKPAAKKETTKKEDK